MNTDSPQRKSSSHKKRSMKKDDIISRIIANDWNPFERADPRVLEKVMRGFTKQRRLDEFEDAPI